LFTSIPEYQKYIFILAFVVVVVIINLPFNALHNFIPRISFPRPPLRISPNRHIHQPLTIPTPITIFTQPNSFPQQSPSYFPRLEPIQPVESLLFPPLDYMNALKIT
jgi:hypothetical protein